MEKLADSDLFSLVLLDKADDAEIVVNLKKKERLCSKWVKKIYL